MSNFLDSYNVHDWSKYTVVKPEQKPSGPHFAAVLFETRRESNIDYYDFDDNNITHSNVPEIVYFAFPTKDILSAWLLRATKANKKFFFFEVTSLGEVDISINLSL